jgi:polysaccharide export outer membrane protein
MKYLGIISFVFSLAVANAVATYGQGSPTPNAVAVQQTHDRYRIGPGDVLQISVFRHGDLGQRVPVGPTGNIALFRLDRPIAAACKTEQELAESIAAAYKANFIKDPQVQVTVAEQKSQSIGVIGAIEHAGTYYVSRRYQLLELLALAGGPSKEAGTRVIVARTGNSAVCRDATDPAEDESLSIYNFKIRDIEEGKQAFWMKPGDIVSVLDADIVYVYGNVNEQGQVKVRETITLTQAIASAKGLKSTASKGNVRVLRTKPGATDREEMVFDLNAIDKGKAKDPYLEPGDIVAVSQDSTKVILHGIGDALKSSIPAAAYRL